MKSAGVVFALALWLALAPVAQAGAPGEGAYVVQAGDTVLKIARRFSVPASTLITLNKLANPNRIRVGQVLRIPAGLLGALPPALIAAPQVRAKADLLPPPSGMLTVAGPGGIPISGSAAFIANMQAVMQWLASNDPAALQRVESFVTTITPSITPQLAWARMGNGSCNVEMLAGDVPMIASVMYHEASHCQQWAEQGLQPTAAAEWYAYSEQLDFMRRHNFDPFFITVYELVRSAYGSAPPAN